VNLTPDSLSTPLATAERSVLCPGCGYDLRAATEDRCSECGLVVDRTALRQSGIPWAHRKEIGRITSCFKTIWLMTLDAKILRHEAAKPQSPVEAIRFRRIVMLFVAVCLVALGKVLIDDEFITDNVVQKPSLVRAWPLPGYAQDLAVPWSAGVSIRSAWLVYPMLAAIWIVAAPAAVFRTKRMPQEQAQAGKAMGAYVSAPLVWLVPAVAAYLTSRWVHEPGGNASSRGSPLLLTSLAVTWLVLVILAVGSTAHRTGQWKARVTRSGYATGFLAMAELLLLWLLGVGLLLIIVPWCVGILRLFVFASRT
jgi:hypothetical protein